MLQTKKSILVEKIGGQTYLCFKPYVLRLKKMLKLKKKIAIFLTFKEKKCVIFVQVTQKCKKKIL